MVEQTQKTAAVMRARSTEEEETALREELNDDEQLGDAVSQPLGTAASAIGDESHTAVAL